MEQDVVIFHVFLSVEEVPLAVCTHVRYYDNFTMS